MPRKNEGHIKTILRSALGNLENPPAGNTLTDTLSDVEVDLESALKLTRELLADATWQDGSQH